MRKQKDIKHYSSFVSLQLYLYRFTVYINKYIHTHRALFILMKLSTSPVQFLTLEKSKDLSARKVWPIFSNVCYCRMVYLIRYSKYNNLRFNRELIILVQRWMKQYFGASSYLYILLESWYFLNKIKGISV